MSCALMTFCVAGGAIRYQSGGIEHIEYVIIPIGSDPFSTHPRCVHDTL